MSSRKKKRFLILPWVFVFAFSTAFTEQREKIYWGSEVPAGWPGDRPAEFQTVPEKTNFQKTTSHYEILEFINGLLWDSENVHVFNMYTSELRNVCPVVVMASPRVTSPEEANASGKPVVYLQANIHPSEPSGKEALLMLMRDILLGDKKHLLSNQIILVVPSLNVDGNDAWGITATTTLPGLMGTRANALGYDLNRDAIKLETLAVRELYKNVFNRWDPVLVYCTHHIGGQKHAYPIVYCTSNVPAAHPGPRGYVNDHLFPAVRSAVRERWGVETFFHAGTNHGEVWPPTIWTFDLSAWTVEGKFIVSGYGLRNRMSILVESVWHNTFKKHIYSQYAYAHELLEYTNTHGKEMMKVCLDADKDTVDKVIAKAESGQLKNWVEGKYESKGKVDLFMYPEVEYEYIPGTGIRRIKPEAQEKGPVVIRGIEDVTKPVGIKEATFPRGYLIPAKFTDIAEKLRIHNINIQVLEKPAKFSGEEFVVDNLKKVQKRGYEMTELEGGFFKSTKEFPAGTYQVELAQPLANMAFYCLEPEVGDGFVGWGLFDDYLLSVGVKERSVVYPVFKYLKTIK